jgi:exoribonuclease-2
VFTRRLPLAREGHDRHDVPLALAARDERRDYFWLPPAVSTYVESVNNRSDLQRLARQAMLSHGMAPGFDPAATAEVAALRSAGDVEGALDLRALPWCSIDNDDSRDLDQLSVAEKPGADGSVKIRVAIADVDALVAKGSAVDRHAALNTTSVYTAGGVFPMLPERLSTDLTSLNPDVDRAAIVIEYVVEVDGSVRDASVFRAVVRNHAQLAYHAVGDWLAGSGALPTTAAHAPGLDEQLKIQDEAASWLRRLRYQQGALDLQSLESRVIFDGDRVASLEVERPNRAHWLIEDFMIAANGVVARYLESQGRPGLRRVVRAPERWAKIVAVAAEYGDTLPAQPSASELERFLARRRAADPLRFPDLSLIVVKLMGRGEYVAEAPGQPPIGHFGLAVHDYSHSTAPNRRFPDLITHRLVKAALAERPSPYTLAELSALGEHCTLQESNANKVERQVRKSAAALLLQNRVGQIFDGVVTGVSDKGTYVRVFDPPVEGRILRRADGHRVGDRVRVELLGTDFERGYVDFSGV